jgi:superfamily II DNA/RNA helicase
VKTDVRLLRERCPDVLVGTPGRLNDLLENHGLAQLVRGLTNLVFDEADQLLEMGFRPAIGESHIHTLSTHLYHAYSFRLTAAIWYVVTLCADLALLCYS